jgi:hypothetical protein
MSEETLEEFTIKTPTPFNYTDIAPPSSRYRSNGSGSGSNAGGRFGSRYQSSGLYRRFPSYYPYPYYPNYPYYPYSWWDYLNPWYWFYPRDVVIQPQFPDDIVRIQPEPMDGLQPQEPIDYTNTVVVILLAMILIYLVYSRK